MNKQRKVLITITYNEMGIIIDTKAEEVAQPEQRWIPVTESVPKDRKIYLVTLDNNTTDFCMWNGSRWGFYGNHGWSECDEVIAWMPLPEPYKEGE